MKRLIQFAVLFAGIGTAFAADTPRIGLKPPPPVGPLVDVTLKSGESNKGQLVSFADGSLTMRLDNGDVVTQDGASVVSVRFIADEKLAAQDDLASSQVTQLTPDDFRKIQKYRMNERKDTISREDELDFKRLRMKLDVHIKALEREIPKVSTLLEAEAKLADLAHSYFLSGTQWEIVKSNVKVATNGIENDTLREKASANNGPMFLRMEEERNKIKTIRPLLKPGDKAPDKPGPPATTEKPKEF